VLPNKKENRRNKTNQTMPGIGNPSQPSTSIMLCLLRMSMEFLSRREKKKFCTNEK